MLPLFALLRRVAEPNPIVPSLLPLPHISSICGTSNTINLSGTQKILSIPVVRRYSTGSFSYHLLPLNDPDILTLLIAHLAVISLLLLSLLTLNGAKCFDCFGLIKRQHKV